MLLACSRTSRWLLEVVRANRSRGGCRCCTENLLPTDVVGKRLLAVFRRWTTGGRLVSDRFYRLQAVARRLSIAEQVISEPAGCQQIANDNQQQHWANVLQPLANRANSRSNCKSLYVTLFPQSLHEPRGSRRLVVLNIGLLVIHGLTQYLLLSVLFLR